MSYSASQMIFLKCWINLSRLFLFVCSSSSVSCIDLIKESARCNGFWLIQLKSMQQEESLSPNMFAFNQRTALLNGLLVYDHHDPGIRNDSGKNIYIYIYINAFWEVLIYSGSYSIKYSSFHPISPNTSSSCNCLWKKSCDCLKLMPERW